MKISINVQNSNVIRTGFDAACKECYADEYNVARVNETDLSEEIKLAQSIYVACIDL